MQGNLTITLKVHVVPADRLQVGRVFEVEDDVITQERRKAKTKMAARNQ